MGNLGIGEPSGDLAAFVEALAEVIAQFLPSTQGLEKELQETAAILECTDRQFLPAKVAGQLERDGGRAKASSVP